MDIRPLLRRIEVTRMITGADLQIRSISIEVGVLDQDRVALSIEYLANDGVFAHVRRRAKNRDVLGVRLATNNASHENEGV